MALTEKQKEILSKLRTVENEIMDVTHKLERIACELVDIPNIEAILNEIDHNEDEDWSETEQLKEIKEPLSIIESNIVNIREQRNRLTKTITILKKSKRIIENEYRKRGGTSS
jgi:prefoldin subunit 5